MKKLTIFRRCEADVLSSRLIRDDAYKLLSLAKCIKEDLSVAPLIISSHVPCAVFTAKVLQLVNSQAKVSEEPFLSHYYAGASERFLKRFQMYIQNDYRYSSHIILVTHNMNIFDLAGHQIRMGNCLTLEAETWQDIFNKDKRNVSTWQVRVQEKHRDVTTLGETSSLSVSICCSESEKRSIDHLLF